jgi:hypothetical protein
VEQAVGRPVAAGDGVLVRDVRVQAADQLGRGEPEGLVKQVRAFPFVSALPVAHASCVSRPRHESNLIAATGPTRRRMGRNKKKTESRHEAATVRAPRVRGTQARAPTAATEGLAFEYHMRQTLAALHVLRDDYRSADKNLLLAIILRLRVALRYGRLDPGHRKAIAHLERTRAVMAMFWRSGRMRQFKLTDLLSGCAEVSCPGLVVPPCRRLYDTHDAAPPWRAGPAGPGGPR